MDLDLWRGRKGYWQLSISQHGNLNWLCKYRIQCWVVRFCLERCQRCNVFSWEKCLKVNWEENTNIKILPLSLPLIKTCNRFTYVTDNLKIYSIFLYMFISRYIWKSHCWSLSFLLLHSYLSICQLILVQIKTTDAVVAFIYCTV